MMFLKIFFFSRGREKELTNGPMHFCFLSFMGFIDSNKNITTITGFKFIKFKNAPKCIYGTFYFF